MAINEIHLVAALARKGWNRSDLADALGVSTGAISVVVEPVYNRPATVERMAETLGVSVKYLETGPFAPALVSCIKIRERMKLRGMNQKDLAAVMGCNPQNISRLVNKGHKMNPRTLGRVARALECDPEELLQVWSKYPQKE